MSSHPDHTLPPSRSVSSSAPKPKGILKNAQPLPSPAPGQHLQWDEANLALTELQKDSLMKITEPKTPYVRYNAETDTFEGDIPGFDLGGGIPSPVRTQSPSSTGADYSGPSSRRTSFSSAGRPSVSGRSGSGSSSRSTSFNLPADARGEIVGLQGERGEVELEEMDEETAAKHAAFIRARGRHYSNEAEAMKKAHQLMDEDEETESQVNGDGESEDVSMDDEHPKVNGTVHGA
ncbi:hypothetical protein EW146_g3117 [Bondarzewia mesenterica]|uniref:Protein phosphatase inhibitor 2 (IPP-2) n=1 Tax=Bondarzewia mesenterica TaxID=1095465 RepID=A0A4S4LYI8_9AGAM|nr:hypothetical protein EW146_g3117 [Bondarzewia mesenterica]